MLESPAQQDLARGVKKADMDELNGACKHTCALVRPRRAAIEAIASAAAQSACACELIAAVAIFRPSLARIFTTRAAM